MLEQEVREEPAKTDELSDIRRQYEQAELEESLKGVLFGGYSKKKVNEVISTYKEMVGWMQESFDYRLSELNKEKERICNERVVLKKQLGEELEKNKKLSALEEETKQWKRQYLDLREQYEASDKELQLSLEEKEKLFRDYKTAENRLKELEQKLKEQREQLAQQREQIAQQRELARQKEIEHQKELEYQKELGQKRELEYQRELERQRELVYQKELAQQEWRGQESAAGSRDESSDTGDGSGVIAILTAQLEELTAYCESMETQQKSLETQLSSMKNISQELEKLSLQYEENQSELKDARRKYANIKNENRALNSEMESTGRILAEILEQFEQKESENDILRREVSETQDQLMTVKREKLMQEQANLKFMERAYSAERECNEAKEELIRVKKELEELQRKCSTLENSKVIKIQSTAESGREEPDKKGYASEKERIDEVLRRALAVTERAAVQEEEKKENEQTMNAANGKEVL